MTTDANCRTVAAYERHARDYAHAVPPQPSDAHAAALQRFFAALPRARVLDIGSGPGWDADYLETLGATVHRTDVTAAFRAFQAERGKHVDALDLLTDRIDGIYDGIALLCVIQHFERAAIEGVLRKLHGALVDGGALLLSHPLGGDENWQHGQSGDYRVVRWTGDTLDPLLAAAGFAVDWSMETSHDEGPWRTALMRRDR